MRAPSTLRVDQLERNGSSVKKAIRAVFASTASLAVFALVSSPALAVSGPSLPANDKLYVIECDSTDALALQLYGVNPVTGEPTTIGEGLSGSNSCAYQGAQQPGTDWFYYLDNPTLLRVDLVTGDTEVVGDFSVGGSPEYGVYSLTFGPDGTAYALAFDNLYTIDLTNAELTYLSAPAVYDIGEGYPYAFAYDYTTQKFYFVEDGDDGLYELVPSSGEKTLLATNTDYEVYSMAFDADGNLWVNGSGDYVSKLALADFGNSAAWQDSPDLVVGQGTLYSESLWVSPKFAPKPELPDTGFDVAGIVAIGALLSIAGAAIVVMRRRA
jgi:LPXTG-motif cell wall-anchored protein